MKGKHTMNQLAESFEELERIKTSFTTKSGIVVGSADSENQFIIKNSKGEIILCQAENTLSEGDEVEYETVDDNPEHIFTEIGRVVNEDPKITEQDLRDLNKGEVLERIKEFFGMDEHHFTYSTKNPDLMTGFKSSGIFELYKNVVNNCGGSSK